MFLLMQILLYEIHHSPVHKYQFWFENGDFFSAVWPTVDTYSAETVTGNASFLKGSPEWKRWLLRLRADGQKRMFSNTMIPCIIYYSQNTCSVRDAIVFPLIDDFEETGENDSNTLPVSKTGIFFWKTEEKSPFSKISEYVWTGPK